MLSYQTDPILLSTVTLFLKCIRGSWGIRYSSWGIFVCIFLFFNQLRLNLRFHTSLAYSAQYFSTLSYNFFLYVSVSPLEFFLDWWMNVDINATHQYFWFSSPEYTRGGGVVAINLALASKMWAEVLGQKHLTTSVRFSRALPPPPPKLWNHVWIFKCHKQAAVLSQHRESLLPRHPDDFAGTRNKLLLC